MYLGDGLSYHNGMKFSTKDRDNDVSSTTNCAAAYTGSWWYADCYLSNLNGQFKVAGDKGIKWAQFSYFYNGIMKTSTMMIRKKTLYML